METGRLTSAEAVRLRSKMPCEVYESSEGSQWSKPSSAFANKVRVIKRGEKKKTDLSVTVPNIFSKDQSVKKSLFAELRDQYNK